MRYLAVIGLLAITSACDRKTDQPPPEFKSPAAPASPVPAGAQAAPLRAKFTLADFNKLRYLEGTWRGTLPSGGSFYESFHFVNDSSILHGAHTDSTFKTKSDSSMILFRGGQVADSGATWFYLATSIDSAESRFQSIRNSRNHNVWTRESADAWTARLTSVQRDSTEKLTVYPMKRIRR